MSRFNAGRTIGRVSIRVLPDTRDFNKLLRKQLDGMAEKITAAVKIDKADLDRDKIRADIERQMAGMDVDSLAAKVAVSIDKAKLKKTSLRKSIQEQFDKFDDIRVNINAQIHNSDEFQREVKRLVREASRNRVNITAGANTLAAAAQLRYTARDRIVQFIAHANEGALIRTATALAALGGARLAGNWAEDIIDFAKELDKSLPKILTWTTGITSAVAAVTALTGGLVGIGGGLFQITPALLVLPGLALNAVGSITALIVAWRNANTELAPLGDGMRELGDIINTTYWDRARQPILDLVNGLLPQMKNAFRDLSEGVGEFTGALANAFGVQLADGRFESIFAGIADGWRVLATGADGFAGAIVSLSQIAAKYTPRLAGWFVRQANTFDAFLTSIATDGRLERWMEGAIDSMYDLWDATTGFAGVLEGLYTAADAAGGGGLPGFAEMMQTWERTVKGADFQRGMTAVFRGANVAMTAFGDGIRAVGQLVADLDGAFEFFIGSSGQFLGGLVEGIANALNSPAVGAGLTNLSAGLIGALDGIGPSLQPIADTFGGFLTTLGGLASGILPTAVGAVADLLPSVETLMGVVDRVVPSLTGAVDSFVDDVAPAINSLVEALGPSLETVFQTLADALEDIGPDIASLAEGLTPALASAMETLALALKPLAVLSGGLFDLVGAGGKAMQDLSWLWDDKKLGDVMKDLIDDGTWVSEIARWSTEVDKNYATEAKKHADTYVSNLSSQFGTSVSEQVSGWTTLIKNEFDKNDVAGNTMWESFVGSDIPPDVKAKVLGNLAALGIEVETQGSGAGGGFSVGLAAGILNGMPSITSAAGGIKGGVSNATSGANQWLNGRGAEVMSGFKSGVDGGMPGVTTKMGTLKGTVTGALPNPFGMLLSAGSLIMGGLLSGLRSAWTSVTTFISGIGPWIRNNKGPESYDRQLLVKPGEWIMVGLERGLAAGFGRVKSRVSGMADEIRAEFDLSSGISAGIEKGMQVARTTRLPFTTDPDGDAPGVGRGGNQINVTMPLLPGETPQEQRDNLVEELRWVS